MQRSFRVLFDENKRAVGVEHQPSPTGQTGQRPITSRTIKAKRMVIVSAGTCSTPSTLERSGIGYSKGQFSHRCHNRKGPASSSRNQIPVSDDFAVNERGNFSIIFAALPSSAVRTKPPRIRLAFNGKSETVIRT